MKLLLIIIFSLTVTNIYASTSQDCNVTGMQESYCYELADWNDTALDELDYCLDTIEVLDVYISADTQKVAVVASLVEQGEFLEAIFTVDSKTCEIRSMI